MNDLESLVHWAEYLHLNEEARRAYDRDGHSVALRMERRKRDNRRHRVRVRVPMAEGCTGVSSGSSFAYGCWCEHCLPRVKASRAAALATKLAEKAAPPEPDQLAIEQVLGGHRMHLRPFERREAVRQAVAKGKTTQQIADMLDQDERSIQRHVVRLKEEGLL